MLQLKDIFQYSLRCKWKKPDDVLESECTKLYVSDHEKEMKTIYLKLSPADQIKICSINKNAVKGLYPILRKQNKLSDYWNKRNPSRIKQYVKAFGRLFLPKRILIYNKRFYTYVGPNLTRFSERSLNRYNLELVELDNFYLVTKKSQNSSRVIQTDTVHISLNAPSSCDTSDRLIVTDNECSYESNRNLNHENNDIDVNHNNDTQLTDSNEIEMNDINDERDIEISDDESGTTEPLYSSKYRNMLLTPEKYSNEQIMSLVHCSKVQFKTCVEYIQPLMGKIEVDTLSVNARVFLFRLKVNFQAEFR